MARWVYTHAMQIPRKFVQFLPPLMVGSLLEFLENPSIPSSVGWKLMALAGACAHDPAAWAVWLFFDRLRVVAALRMICDKLAQGKYTSNPRLPVISGSVADRSGCGCSSLPLQRLQRRRCPHHAWRQSRRPRKGSVALTARQVSSQVICRCL